MYNRLRKSEKDSGIHALYRFNIPGIVIGAFVDDKKSGRFLGAQNFTGMTLEDAVKKAEAEFDSPY